MRGASWAGCYRWNVRRHYDFVGEDVVVIELPIDNRSSTRGVRDAWMEWAWIIN